MKKLLVSIAFIPFLANAQNIITTVAGSGVYTGATGDGGPATAAFFWSLHGMAFDKNGNIFLSTKDDVTIRKIDPTGIVTLYGGQYGLSGYVGDGGPATSARLYWPHKITTDTAGNLYIADFNNNSVRKISTTGIITTVAGGLGCLSSGVDGDPATSVCLSTPACVRFDRHGNLYIAENTGMRIRKVNSAGIISTVTGNGSYGSSGDGGPATAAQINYPTGMAFDTGGNLYFVENNSCKVRKISTLGIVSTIAGNGTPGYSGDGGPATNAMLRFPEGVVTDSFGNVFIADMGNHRIRKISPSGIITTYAGSGIAPFSGDGGPATAAAVGYPTDIVLDSLGDLYVTEAMSQRVRKIIRCSSVIISNPVNDTTVEGDTARYSITTSLPAPTFQWQQDTGTGFFDLANVWPFSGVFTNSLMIENAGWAFDHRRYRCVTSIGSDCTDTSSSSLLVVTPPAGLGAQFSEQITIVPNPTRNSIFIKVPWRFDKGQLQLFNNVGIIVTDSDFKNKLDIANLPNGIYTLRVILDRQIFVKKIIKE